VPNGKVVVKHKGIINYKMEQKRTWDFFGKPYLHKLFHEKLQKPRSLPFPVLISDMRRQNVNAKRPYKSAFENISIKKGLM